uniref:Histidine phosphotransferase n=1 Tax=Paulinella chromatophora TaxID=39717 RepID=B1X529_PAUCH|nr:hypothetical protein PCC_0621 [Paulinella chromatophora]ACB43048.1 hypothetical protein PCC_0621 [Paulinella chromatophora]|eukprot:gb/GEZN01009508.1/.p1 GENE.gb/GEZN01009508.1/~~gb/GEZN01009508.1/.p1  ORF type:complete len:212 (+),score=3.56 gb/GEZN01009508.1/:557-1192(+)
MGFETGNRITRRRTSAGPTSSNKNPAGIRKSTPGRQDVRPTFLTLRDHGKLFVADLPRLSDGQLAHVGKEAQDVLESLKRRLEDIDKQNALTQTEQETLIRASTKRDVTYRFISAVQEEQEQRHNNSALRDAARESLSRTFLEIARRCLPGTTFDSILQEALAACDEEAVKDNIDNPVHIPTKKSAVEQPLDLEESLIPIGVIPENQLQDS